MQSPYGKQSRIDMNLKWQVVMLTMRVKRFIQKTGRKLDLNGKETVGFDRKMLNATTAIGEVTLLENVGHQGIRGIETEMLQQEMHQWTHLLQMLCVSATSFKDQASTASYVDDVMFSFFSNQSNAPQLDNEDLKHIDTDDLKDMNLKWQVVMLTMRVKRFIQKTGRKLDLIGKETVGFDRKMLNATTAIGEDETSKILKNFIFGIENQMDHKVKTTRSNNGTKFKNGIMNEFCEMKGIRKEFSIARTLQQNGIKSNIDAGQAGKKTITGSQYVLIPLLTTNSQGPKSSDDEVVDDVGKKSTKVLRKKEWSSRSSKIRLFGQGEAANTNSTNRLNTVSSLVNTVSSFFTIVDPGRERAQRNEFESMFGQDKDANGNMIFTPVSAAGYTYVCLGRSIPVNAATLPNADLHTDSLMPDLEDTTDIGIFSGAYDDEVEGVKADFNNLKLTTVVSPILTTRIHKDHPKEQIIGDLLSALQTRRMTKTSQEHDMVSYIKKQRRTNHKGYQNCLLACFLSQIEPKKVIQALIDPS
nr:putative ribonuclease H-like domain-containing protein [Tanacetum cinerariifolium]